MPESITYVGTPLPYVKGSDMNNIDMLIDALANPSPMANPDFADISANGREIMIRELNAIKVAGQP